MAHRTRWITISIMLAPHKVNNIRTNKQNTVSLYTTNRVYEFVPNKKGDIGMWVGSHPKSFVTFVVVLLISNIELRMWPHPHSCPLFYLEQILLHSFPSFFMKVKIFRKIFHTKILVESRNVIWRVWKFLLNWRWDMPQSNTSFIFDESL
jgi:hypothetical protein